ncbi:MAG: 50S ribosomal protein L23 [Clostridia bacterium]|nr:50S ribosomal protein L23 [Clostridia bacterium]
MDAYDIILRPVLSEKTYDGIPNKRYTFIVAGKANKIQVKEAVESIFNVKVGNVNTVNYKGKFKRQGRSEGYTSKFKKAIVTLKEDSKGIEFFDSLSGR